MAKKLVGVASLKHQQGHKGGNFILWVGLKTSGKLTDNQLPFIV